MGQKTHPIGFRVGITRSHDSRWYANKKDFPRLLKQDQDVRGYIKRLFYGAQIPRIETRDRFPRTQNGETVGMIGPHSLSVQLKHQIIRCVIDRADLLEHYVALELEIPVAQCRVSHQIRENVQRSR